MTDRYADLRKATHLRSIFCSPEAIFGYRAAANHETIRALLADYDRMRDALWVATEHNALHFGENHSAVIQGRAALAQEGS